MVVRGGGMECLLRLPFCVCCRVCVRGEVETRCLRGVGRVSEKQCFLLCYVVFYGKCVLPLSALQSWVEVECRRARRASIALCTFRFVALRARCVCIAV